MTLVFGVGCSSNGSSDSESSDSSYSSEDIDNSSDSEDIDSSESESSDSGSESEDIDSSADSESSDCEAGYSPCVPKYPPDLNCADIGQQVEVTGSDPHGLDRDGDGVGCESY